MKAIITITLLTLCALIAEAQTVLPSPSQELFPMESSVTYHTPAYHTKLRAVLFKQLETDEPFSNIMMESKNEFQFLKLPPFTPETLLTVTERETNYVAVLLTPEKQIWSFDGDTADLSVDRKVKFLPSPVALRADRLWQEMLIRARFADTGGYPDATSYCFLKWIKGAGTIAGETHSRNNTRPSILVDMALNLIQYVNADAKNEKAILKNLDELMDKLEKELRKDKKSSNQSMEATK